MANFKCQPHISCMYHYVYSCAPSMLRARARHLMSFGNVHNSFCMQIQLGVGHGVFPQGGCVYVETFKWMISQLYCIVIQSQKRFSLNLLSYLILPK